MNSPFKFLDAYTRQDKDSFFGRDLEIEDMYQKVFESKILLVYGISGTGKTSIINCGLANKFEDSDWLPINVRRGSDMNSSLEIELEKAALTKVDKDSSILKRIKSLYLDYFKPVYLIFDQFEELFIFGSDEERDSFIKLIRDIAASDIECRLIFSVREEYLANVSDFEYEIPEFMANKLRIGKMTSLHAKEVIEGSCRVHGIELEGGFADKLLEKLNPKGKQIELTYLQVYLDKIYRQASSAVAKSKKVTFTNALLDTLGDVGDLLGAFLEDQIKELDDPDSGLAVLKSFVSIKGTKRQITFEEISESCRSLGQEVKDAYLRELINKFVDLRILREKDDNGRYELRHDSLASKIYEKITLFEKELMEVRQFIENAYSNYEKRKVYLTVKDLKYIAPYEDKLFLNKQNEQFVEDSKQNLQKVKKRIKRVAVTGFIAIMIIAAGYIFKLYGWPFAGVLSVLGLIVYSIAFLPLFVYYLITRKENRTINLLLLTFSIFVLGSILYSRQTIFPDALFGVLIEADARVNIEHEELDLKNALLYSEIMKLSSDHLTLPDHYVELAKQIKDESYMLIQEIEGVKIAMISVTQPEYTDVYEKIIITDVKNIAETNIPSELMIIAGKGEELQQSIQEYRTFLLDELIQNCDQEKVDAISNYLNTDDTTYENGGTVSWESDRFEHLPMGGVIMNLSYIQSDIKRAESIAYSYLLDKIKSELDEE